MARSRERPVVAWMLRSFLLLNFLSAVGFIAYAFILQNPPKTALPLGLLIVGVCALVAVLVGLVGSLRINCCLTLYLYLGSLITLAELGLTLSMFFNYGNTVDDLVKYEQENDPDFTQADKQELKDKVAGGRWFFLVVCILQFISVLVAVVLRVCVYPRERDFENFDEGGEADARPSSSQIQMQKLQQSVSGRSPGSGSLPSPGAASYASSKLYKSTTAKMAAKYGDYAQDSEFQQKKGWFGRK